MPTAFVKLICFCIFISLAYAAKAGGGAKSSAINRFSAQDTVDYWTTERMKNAIPRDVIRKDDGTHVRREITQQDIQQMEEYFRKLPPAVHSPGKDSILFPTYSKEENHNSERNIVQQATDYSSFPWKAVGKIFFVLDGKNYVCSGAVLGKYVIATAGHCLQSDSMWAVNVTFVPAYNNRKRPFGTFSFHKLYASDEWVNTGKFCKDYGFAVMNKLGGHGVGDYVGYFGYSYNVRLNATHKWRSLGYPAAEPFNGENNYYVDGFFTRRETTSSCSPGTIYLRSDATGGASGGPWIHNFGSQNLLNGLNSYKHEGVFDSMFGPYFDTEWFNVFSLASSITPP